MARVRPIRNYPLVEYRALFDRVRDTNAGFTIPCTRTQALSLRSELYAFRKAVARDPDSAQTCGLDVEAISQISFRVLDDGLLVQPVSHQVGPSLIQAALGMQPAPVVDTAAASASLNRLLDMMNADRGPDRAG